MAKKKTEPTFEDRQRSASQHIETLRAQFDDLRFYGRLIWDGFASAYQVAVNRGYYKSFGADIAVVFAHCSWRWEIDKRSFWSDWPSSGPYTFGFYRYAGTSALQVADHFMRAVNLSAQLTMHAALKSHQVDSITDTELEHWAEVLSTDLNDRSLLLGQWPAGILRRDFEVIVQRFKQEFAWSTELVKAFPKESPIQHEANEPVATITTPQLYAILRERMKNTSLTQLEIGIRQLRRITSKWPKVEVINNTKHFSWEFVRKTMLDDYKIDIGPPLKVRA